MAKQLSIKAGSSKPKLEAIYEEMEPYIERLARKNASAHILMHVDELRGELGFELVKVYNHYIDKKTLPMEEWIMLFGRCLSNRIRELKAKYYGTGRRKEMVQSDIDDFDDTLESQDAYVPHDRFDSDTDFTRFINLLSPDEYAIVEAVLTDDRRIRNHLHIRAARRSFVYKNCVVKVDATLVSRALHIPLPHVRQLWKSISNKWYRVYSV